MWRPQRCSHLAIVFLDAALNITGRAALCLAGAEEGGALFQMYDGSARIANVKGPLIEIHNQLALSGQNGLPSVRFDVMAINGLFKSFLTAGFYYKTFMGPFSNTKFWMLCERFIRKAAGMGAATRDADPDNYDIANGFCDLACHWCWTCWPDGGC